MLPIMRTESVLPTAINLNMGYIERKATTTMAGMISGDDLGDASQPALILSLAIL
jgi:hypothetical protein